MAVDLTWNRERMYQDDELNIRDLVAKVAVVSVYHDKGCKD